MFYPLVGLCLCYVLGILTGTRFDFNITFLYSILIIAFVSACFLIKKNISRFPIYICMFLIGMIVVHTDLLHPLHISNLVSGNEEGSEKAVSQQSKRGGGFASDAKSRKLSLKGVVISEPEENTLIMRVEEVSDMTPKYPDGSEKYRRFEEGRLESGHKLKKSVWKEARGLVLVRVKEWSIRQKILMNNCKINCEYGDRIRIRNAYLSIPASPRNPGEFDYREYLLRNKIYAVADIFQSHNITVLGKGCVNPIIRLSLFLKSRMEIIIRRSMSQPQSLFLEAVLLGNRWRLPEEWKEIFSHTGTAHILSISGLHVGFIFSISLILFRILNFPLKISSLLTIVVVIMYCLLTGGRPPAVRASIMAVIVLTGMILERPVNIWNSLALSAFLILILNPLELFNPGFQMSFMAVSGIIYINPRLGKLWNPSNGFLRWVWKAVTVITGAQIAILPLSAYYFNIFPLISFPANLVVVPILGLVVGLGFSACICGAVWIGFAHLFSAANWVVITVLLKIIDFFKSIPGSCIYVPSPPVYLMIFYYLGVFVLIRMMDEFHTHDV